MKKLIVLILAVAGLMVGCSSNKGGSEDQTQMNTGKSSSTPAGTDTNNATGSPQQ